MPDYALKLQKAGLGRDLAPNAASRQINRSPSNPFASSSMPSSSMPDIDTEALLRNIRASVKVGQKTEAIKKQYGGPPPSSITDAQSSPALAARTASSSSSSSSALTSPVNPVAWSSPRKRKLAGREASLGYLNEVTPKTQGLTLQPRVTTTIVVEIPPMPRIDRARKAAPEGSSSNSKKRRRPVSDDSSDSDASLPTFQNRPVPNKAPKRDMADEYQEQIKASGAPVALKTKKPDPKPRRTPRTSAAASVVRESPPKAPVETHKRQLRRAGSKASLKDSPVASSSRTVSEAVTPESAVLHVRRSEPETLQRRSSQFIEITSSPLKPDAPEKPAKSKKSSAKVKAEAEAKALAAAISNEEMRLLAERFDAPATQVARATGRLCPFCDRELSRSTPRSILALLNRIEAKFGAKATRKASLANKNHIEVPLLERAAVCNAHSQWSDEIPEGQRRGWPAAGKIDFAGLPKRLQPFLAELSAVASGTAKSPFFKDAAQSLGARGISNPASEFASFDTEMPGYYGPKGFECLYAHLAPLFTFKSAFLQPEQIRPLDPQQFVRRVLVPEAAVRLVMEDRKCGRDAAIEIVVESRLYGMAVNGLDEDA